MTSIALDTLSLQDAFNTLNRRQKISQWKKFLQALDAGDAGYHPFYLLLAPLYAAGDQPV
jgi:hypothetical protein